MRKDRTKAFHRQRAKHFKKKVRSNYIYKVPTDEEIWKELEAERPKWYKREENPYLR